MKEREHNEHGPVVAADSMSVESQSSQLLDFVLGKADPTDVWVNARDAADEENTSADRQSEISGDVSLLSAYVVPYHFHGLASTQTQTHSRKEKAPSQGQNTLPTPIATAPCRAVLRSSSADPSHSSPKPLTPSRAKSTSSLGPLSSRVLPQSTKVVTFLSPGRQAQAQKASSNASSMRFHRRRSSSIPSQDSFAGPTALEDPDLFLATSRQFERPLEKLGRPDSQEQTPPQTHVEDQSLEDSGPSSLGSNTHRDSMEMRQYSRSSTPSGGRILVPSSVSSGPSQDSQQTRAYDVSLSQQATQVLDSSDTSISEHSDGRDVTQNIAGATQSEPTQVATQEVTQAVSFPGRNPVARQSVVGSRSLLVHVPPEKRGKYNSPALSETSRVATAGTSSAGSARSPLLRRGPLLDEEIVQDSEQQIDVNRSTELTETSREVIPPSVSDVPDMNKVEEEEETEEDSEEDEPINVSSKPASRASVKGKQKAKPSMRGAASPKVEKKADIPRTERAYVRPSPVKAPAVASPAPLVVPFVSAGPKDAVVGDVDMGRTTEFQPDLFVHRGRAQPRGSTKGKGKGKEATAPPVVKPAPMTRQKPARAVTPAISANGQDEDDNEVESPAIPLAKARRTEEEETEIADDDQMDADEFVDEKPVTVMEPGPSARKRKRRIASVGRKAGKGKAVTRRTTTRAASTVPPPAKKPRILASSSGSVVARFGAGLGTQVFALFKNDSSYYGAEVHALNGSRGHVKYFDGLEDPNLGVTQMRRFELRIGDTVIPVIPDNKPLRAKIIDDSLWATENEVRVEYIEGPDEGVEFVVEADTVRIPARIVQSQWKDRVLEASDIFPAVGRKPLKNTPSPSKMSVVSTVSTKTSRTKALSKYGFIITLGPGNDNWAREKEKFVSAIKEGGGTVLGDWLDIFSLQGKLSNVNKRWTLQRDDVKYIAKDKGSIDRVFLIADVFNQKPKFLIALALGIPCVSTDWVEKVADGEDATWESHLLPAGYSEQLGAPVSQMIDLDWGTTTEHLTEIMENKVPHKVLADASVLCIGADLLPLPGKKSTTTEASRSVPRIVLSMGAARVEAVADVRYASEGDLSRYDYVVVKDTLPPSVVRNATYVDVTWLKECLIAGRLFPLPEWN